MLLINTAANATKYYSRATGNWSSTSTWSTTAFNGAAAASYPGQSSANDTAYISSYTVTVDISPVNSIKLVSITQTNTFLSLDTKLSISTASIKFICAAFTMADNNVNTHMDLLVSSSALFQVNGNVMITRSTSNTRDKRIQVLIMNTARMNVTGNFTYTFNRASNGTGQGNEIQLDDSGCLDITGTLALNMGNINGSNNVLNLVMNNTSVLNASSITQTVSNSNDGDDIFTNLNGGTMTISGTWTSTVTTTATITNSVTLYVDGGTLSTGNFTFAQSGGSSGDMSIFMNQTSTANASLVTVNGNLLFTHDDGDDMEIEVNANATINVTGKFNTNVNVPSNGDVVSFDINGGTFTIADSLNATFNSNTNYFEIFIDGGSLTTKGMHFEQYGTGVGDMYIYLNNSSTTTASYLTIGTYGLQFEDNGGDNMDFEINGNSTVTINGNVAFNNNASNGNDRDMIKMNSGTIPPSLTINGNFTGNMNTGTSSGDEIFLDINGGSFNCTGNMTLTTASVCTGASHCTVEIDGNATSFIVGGTFTLNHNNADVNSKDYIYLGTNSGSPSFTAGGLVLNAQAGNATTFKTGNAVVATINGNVTLTAISAGKAAIDLNGTTVFQLKGNFIRSSSPNRFGSLITGINTTVKYIGTSNTQTIAGDLGDGGDGFSYENVEINNTYASIPQLSITAAEGNATIHGTLTLSNGIISSLSTAMIVIANGGTSTGGNANSFVDGPIKKLGNTPSTYIFPVGNGTVWARLGISQLTNFGTSTEFTCQYYFSPAPNNSPGYMGNTIGVALDYVSYREYWDLERLFDIGNNASCQVTLYWEDSARSKINSMPDLRVSNFETTGTGKWENQGQGSYTQSGHNGTITSSIKISTFSLLTFGSWQGINPLPVELLSFVAQVTNAKIVQLKWEALSQINNDYFTLERSQDGIQYEELTRIEGAGNSTQQINYEAKDLHPFSGKNYYRLKQTDFNGKISYSKVEVVQLLEKQPQIQLYPNPSKGIVHVIQSNGYSFKQIRLIDSRGKIVLEKIFLDQSFTFDVNFLPPGIYYLQVISNNSSENTKLVIQ